MELTRRIEEAGLNSWPALQQLLCDGWVVRFAQGYTKRANSVTPLYPSLMPAQTKLAWCERVYQERQLPPTFRLLSFAEESLPLDALLATRGYVTLDRTLVWSLPLPSGSVAEQPAVRALSLDDWLPIYARWTSRLSDLQHVHRAMLAHISLPVIYAALYQQDVCVACGLGVLDHDVYGLFDIVTDPAQRRQGYGRQLVRGLLNWGSQHGARLAYLQVVDTNLAAQELYAKLGFQESYHYWYRVQPS